MNYTSASDSQKMKRLKREMFEAEPGSVEHRKAVIAYDNAFAFVRLNKLWTQVM